MRSTYAILILLICLTPLTSIAQFDNNQEYVKEFTWGVTKNTNSWLIGGGFLKFSRQKKESWYETFALEIVNVKHPKELKYSTSAGKRFIWGKANYLYSIRPQYGLEKVLFQKAPQQGVQINANAAGGLSIGLEAPYYVQSLGGEKVIYDPDLYPSPYYINGTANQFRTLGESKIRPGLNAKTGIIFEFGTFRNNVTGIELGLAAELFIKKVEMVYQQENKALFTSAFFSFFWGTRK
ncbi:MAG: hypothetical protein JXQ90_12390 [Cyclobacteriaceae bacterium]